MADISLSGAEVALITALLGAVVTPVVVLFNKLQAEKDRQIVRLEAQNQTLLDAVLSGTKAVENTTTVLKQRTAR